MMISRRTLLIGVAANAAIIAFATDATLAADTDTDYASKKVFKGRVFDLRGRQFIYFANCEFECCRFLADHETSHVVILNCIFLSSDISQLSRIGFDGTMIKDNMTFPNTDSCEVTS